MRHSLGLEAEASTLKGCLRVYHQGTERESFQSQMWLLGHCEGLVGEVGEDILSSKMLA